MAEPAANFDYPPGASPAEIWAILQRIAEQQKETDRISQETKLQMQETDRRMQETDRRMQETDRVLRETARLVKSNGEQIGGLHNSFGELSEYMVGTGTVSRFAELGYHFEDIKERNYKIPGEKRGKTKAEYDLLLENDDTILAVEVKTRPELNKKINDIAHHIRRLEMLKEHRASQGLPPKRILGALAGAIFSREVKKATLQAGLFVIEQSGDMMRIAVPKGFVPQEW